MLKAPARDDGPQSLAEAAEEAKKVLFDRVQGEPADIGEVMEAHDVEQEDFMAIMEPIVPFLLTTYGPVNAVVAAFAFGLLTGMRVGLPSLDIPDFIPDEQAGRDDG